MTIKLIAVDMDGTFLNEDKKYNKARFLAQYQLLKKKGIHFVAASGNQLYTLKNYFSEIASEIAYVAENGAYVVDGEKEIHFSHFSDQIKNEILTDCIQNYPKSTIICGKKGAYIGRDVSEKDLPKLNQYFKKLNIVDDLLLVDDDI